MYSICVILIYMNSTCVIVRCYSNIHVFIIEKEMWHLTYSESMQDDGPGT